jgi:hypothetical protein
MYFDRNLNSQTKCIAEGDNEEAVVAVHPGDHVGGEVLVGRDDGVGG